MKFVALALIVLSVLAVVILYYSIRFGYAVYVSIGLVRAATPYENVSTDTSVPFLVLGDSTAVGVGADSASSTLAGRIAPYIGATYTENHAVSGAEVKDLPSQIAEAKLSHYHLILIQIGANDIINFHSASSTTADLARILAILPSADQVVLITAGNVGGAIIFPPIIRPFYTSLNLEYHAAFAALAQKLGITYVNLYAPPASDPFAQDPGTYLAADGLHPSSAGYGVWAARIEPLIRR